jgi:hypothetical protein
MVITYAKVPTEAPSKMVCNYGDTKLFAVNVW